jgi:hypothetical protein
VTPLRDYRGRGVRFTDERRAHILLHPEMTGMEQALIETLAGPQCVVRSISDPTVELSCRRYAARAGDKYLCVVVKVLLGGAFVITAYLTDQIKQGVVLWSSEA